MILNGGLPPQPCGSLTLTSDDCSMIEAERPTEARFSSGNSPLNMSTLRERKRRGEEIIKKYKAVSGTDPYACAVDALADILLFVAQTESEGTQLLHSAEIDFRNAAESETFLAEG